MANLIPYDMEGKTFTVVAGVAVSGGTLYATGSYTNTVANAENYDYTEVLLTSLASGQFCAGVALYDRASGTSNEVALLRRGIVLARANGNVLASSRVCANTNTADGYPVIGVPTAGRNGDDIIGTALMTAASGEYTYLLLNL